VSLVHALDYGHRTADIDLWRSLLPPSGDAVVEFACGAGRIPAALGWPRWVGVDLDSEAVAAFNAAAPDEAARAHALDMASRDLVSRLLASPGPVGLAFVAFSSLYLVPHEQQAQVIRNLAETCRRGGLVAAEVFVPQPWTWGAGPREEIRRLPDDVFRRTVYRTDPEAQVTVAHRTYMRGAATLHQATERIHWRHPMTVQRLFEDAGLADVRHAEGAPDGMVCVVGRVA